MNILGIDPGLERTGWCIIKSRDIFSGLIQTSRDLSIPTRLYNLQSEIETLILINGIQFLAIEKIIPSKRIFANLDAILQARGVILALAGKFNLLFKEYTPTQVKKSITGSGNAKKEDIIRTIKFLYKIEDTSYTDDVYDAIAIALTCKDHIYIQN